MENPLKYFAELKGPRVERTREHLLEEIVLVAIAAILSGANGWNEIENYGNAKPEWLSSFLRLPGGIPSHDTFNRVFAALATEQLDDGFAAWVGSMARLTAGEVVAIDGKTLRGTRSTAGKALVPMVSAWANSNNPVLAQRKVDDKSKRCPELFHPHANRPQHAQTGQNMQTRHPRKTATGRLGPSIPAPPFRSPDLDAFALARCRWPGHDLAHLVYHW